MPKLSAPKLSVLSSLNLQKIRFLQISKPFLPSSQTVFPPDLLHSRFYFSFNSKRGRCTLIQVKNEAGEIMSAKQYGIASVLVGALQAWRQEVCSLLQLQLIQLYAAALSTISL